MTETTGPLTEPPAIGAAVAVHGVPHTVVAIDGPVAHLEAEKDAAGNIPRTRIRWANLHQVDGAIATPTSVTHDATPEGVVPMADDDPRWERIRKNALDQKSKQAPGLVDHLTDLYAREG